MEFLFVSFVEQRVKARNRVNDRDRDMSTEETAWIFSSMIGLPAASWQKRTCSSYLQRMWVL